MVVCGIVFHLEGNRFLEEEGERCRGRQRGKRRGDGGEGKMEMMKMEREEYLWRLRWRG